MYLQAKSAAAMLDLPISTFYQLVREGRLPPAVSKLGKHQLWRQDQLIASVDPHAYVSNNEKTKIAEGRATSGETQRSGAVLLPRGAQHAERRAENAPAGRSAFAGVLGRT